MKRAFVLTVAIISGFYAYAWAGSCDPHPQAPAGPPQVSCLSADGSHCDPTNNPLDLYTIVVTAEGQFKPAPLDNLLPTIAENNCDSQGNVMPNTMPSNPNVPFNPEAALYTFYNLMDGPPVVTHIDRTSPTDDLRMILRNILKAAKKGNVDQESVSFGLDILEGNPLPSSYRGQSLSSRRYAGFPLLHYNGPNKIKHVQPVYDSSGKLVGGTVTIHQIWFDSHIESDTSLLDPSAAQDVPWEITYVVDVLHRGADDFAPFVMYFDAPPVDTPGVFGPPKVAMDAVFFPMPEGREMTMKVKFAPAKYFNLIYTWGWRDHPPRVQVTENALKMLGGKTLVEWEQDVFGLDPRANKDAAIAQIGELSPAKRMWNDLRQMQSGASGGSVLALARDALAAFDDWQDRGHLPAGVTADPEADLTLFFVNNTIYGSTRGPLTKWTMRPTTFRITLLNGDHFLHGYMNVDFGGSRGWENQFQEAGGSGCRFSFGRNYWWINAGGPFGAINVGPASLDGMTPGQHKVILTLNFEPSRRLRIYNFDPLHHDVAVFSLH